MKLYGITDKNLAWFESYLSNRKQHIDIGEISKTDLKQVLFVSHAILNHVILLS